MMAVVVTVGVIVGTIFVTTLSPQLSYAQNASGGASMVNNQTNASATTTTPSNSTIGLMLGNLVYPLKYQIIGGQAREYLCREGQHHASGHRLV